jgi:anaerobic magnesium-protoporphyrin IX monomethyl ester cyclase
MIITLICADDDNWALGMRSISSSLKQAGHQTRLVFTHTEHGFLNDFGLENIKSLSENSELIGISSMSRSSRKAKAIINVLKPLRKLIVWGGMHPTLYPEDCVGHADMICRGEGEEFMIELAERLSSGRNLKDIRNGAYKENGKFILNDVRPLIGDLDKLPIVDFSFADEFKLDGQAKIQPHPPTSLSSAILLSGSRGCIYHCHYCSNSQLKTLYADKGRWARKMSISRFVEAARTCREKFPYAKYFHFTDEDFFARSLNDFKEFALIYPEKVGLPFECMASPQQITDEKMALLAKTGLWRVNIGVESGSDRVKKEIYNRPMSNDIVLRSAGIVNRYPQVVTYYFFIIGNPYENRMDLLATINLLTRLPTPYFLRVYNLVFIPGTILYKKACQDGIIAGLEDSGYEIDFMAGLDYRYHAWKGHNLYLNGLIFLMAGKSTTRRLGLLPRILISILSHKSLIDFNIQHQAMSKAMIALAQGWINMRREGARLASKIIKNPISIYRLKGKKR